MKAGPDWVGRGVVGMARVERDGRVERVEGVATVLLMSRDSTFEGIGRCRLLGGFSLPSNSGLFDRFREAEICSHRSLSYVK